MGVGRGQFGERFGEGFKAGAHFFAPELFGEPALVAPVGFPLGDVIDGKGGTVIAQLCVGGFKFLLNLR
jgi:hypothetical protein